MVGFCRSVFGGISGVSSWRLYSALLFPCSESGLHFDWCVFVDRWFVIRVFRLRVVDCRVGFGSANCGCKLVCRDGFALRQSNMACRDGSVSSNMACRDGSALPSKQYSSSAGASKPTR